MRYNTRKTSGIAQWGDKFDSSELDRVHQSIKDAYQSGLRVRVRSTHSDGEIWDRTGVVSTTTGWRPAYILMHRSSEISSWDVLGRNDQVVAVWRGRKYEPGTPYGR